MRQADAAVRGGIAGQFPRMERDALPGEALHIGHRRIAVSAGVMLCVLLRGSKRRPSAVSCPFEPVDTVEAAIGTPSRNRTSRCVSRLTITRPAASELRVRRPDIFPGFQLTRDVQDGAAIEVDLLGGSDSGNQDGGKAERCEGKMLHSPVSGSPGPRVIAGNRRVSAPPRCAPHLTWPTARRSARPGGRGRPDPQLRPARRARPACSRRAAATSRRWC